jgi:hypothetical protein
VLKHICIRSPLCCDCDIMVTYVDIVCVYIMMLSTKLLYILYTCSILCIVTEYPIHERSGYFRQCALWSYLSIHCYVRMSSSPLYKYVVLLLGHVSMLYPVFLYYSVTVHSLQNFRCKYSYKHCYTFFLLKLSTFLIVLKCFF